MLTDTQCRAACARQAAYKLKPCALSSREDGFANRYHVQISGCWISHESSAVSNNNMKHEPRSQQNALTP